MTEAAIIAEFVAAFRAHPRFLITSHARPDGDAVGSVLALGGLLEQIGCTVDMVLAGPIPANFDALPGIEKIRIADHAGDETCPAILLECNSTQRTGIAGLERRMLLNIDHHSSGRDFAALNWIDAGACAVTVMVYRIALSSPDFQITTAIAKCLYTGLLTDTGGFTYSSTNAEAFAMAHDLTQRGVEPGRIAQAVIFSNPLSRLRVLGIALNKMQREGAVAWTSISDRELREAEATSEDCEGIVNTLIGIAGIELAAFFRELDGPNEIRLSLRSKGEVNVAQVAEHYGGGGHRNASGVTLPGTMDELAQGILSRLSSATLLALSRPA
ncbi:bifunctional oligoribonuclease/PAP phosphatase NrnA [Granulicella sp. WH15]|uniref:DHH family phosphoesterase n=1 Tax=Granulicella sp. WH15 TaxID=2602070 RepID=UPI001366FEB6|nr:bifunctional oligoribonuclease/PAP phosphatase NrnA [Granulicella sp. WH15]QHN02395.1 bifunctional oligoribonuclease/PAP phosphatase NrnA [Granulicella sp. WH15]